MFTKNELFSLLLLFIATTFMLSCGDTSTPEDQSRDQLITLDFTKEYDSVATRLEDLTDTIEVIHMETTPESLLGYFRATFSVNYILCRTGGQALLFDRTGHYLGQVGRMGKGPDEFRGNSKWAINEDNNFIYCFNSDNSQMIRFFLDSRKIESSFITDIRDNLQEMIILNKDSIAAIRHINRLFPYNFYYLSTQGEFLGGEKWDTTKYFHSGTYSNAFFHQNENKNIILQPSNNDTIFKIKGNQSHPLMTFKKKSYPPKGKKRRIQRFFIYSIDDRKNTVFVKREDFQIKQGDFIVSNNHIEDAFYTYNSFTESIKKVNPLTYNLQGLDINLEDYFFRVVGINTFYFSLPIIDVLDLCDEYLENDPDPEREVEVRKLQESLDINSNPIIVTGKWSFPTK